MNRLRFEFAFLLICFFPALLASQNTSDIVMDTFEETAGRGFVIRTNPSGAKIFIDGIERGITPATFENLFPGEHQIILTREGFADRHFNITLFNNSRLVVSVLMEEARGFVQVTVNKAEGTPADLPLAPQIFAGSLSANSSVATTNKNEDPQFSDSFSTLLNLPAGRRTINARAFGWENASITILVNEQNTAIADIVMQPAEFSIKNASQSRKRFNPENSGVLGKAEYHFEVSAPGTGAMTITSKDGEQVFKKQLPEFDTWIQSVTWDGKDILGNPLPEGIYNILIEAVPFTGQNPQNLALTFETEINYSVNIFPLSLAGGSPGLVFSPLPHILPKESFQVEGGILLGSFSSEKFLASLPFNIGLRFSPLNRLEVSAVFNINPRVDNSSGWGITGNVKYNFFDGSGFPLAFAAGVSYAWAGEDGEAPLSPGKGIALFAPLALELKSFSVALTPSVFWHGLENPAPELLLSAGVLYKGSWYNAGISLRNQIDFTKSKNYKFSIGAEGYIFPPPSNLVFFFQAGMWTQAELAGGYAGIGIGFIF